MKKKQIIAFFIMILLTAGLIFGAAQMNGKNVPSYRVGAYYGCGRGHNGDIWVRVEVSETDILRVVVLEHSETAGKCEPAIGGMPVKILDYQTPYVSAISGATASSDGIKEAVASALLQAQGKAEIMEYASDDPGSDPVPLTYSYKPGVYTASGHGFSGEVTVRVEFSEAAILNVEIISSEDSSLRTQNAADRLPEEIVKWQTYGVDTVSGATATSSAVLDAVSKCVEQAKN